CGGGRSIANSPGRADLARAPRGAWLRGMMLIDEIKNWLLSLGMSRAWAVPIADLLSLFALVFLGVVINLIAKRLILRVVQIAVKKSTVTWDDVFLETGVFTRLSHVAPALVVTTLGPQFFIR